MEPIKLLANELKILNRCKEKSISAYKDNAISQEIHNTHLINLKPLITKFEDALKTLKDENNNK